MDPSKYEKYFSTDGFWSKLKKGAKKAGSKVIYSGLLLFYAVESPKTPLRAKVQVYGALGYLILPLDIVPDLLPIIGYVDDLSVLGLALAAVAKSIDDDVKRKAKSKLRDFLGDEVMSSKDIIDIDGQLVTDKDKDKDKDAAMPGVDLGK
ncbi:YkvA family protein [Paenibacillus alba]|uniref:YkvA family protein n=1 Tax=Paenibacillus alba TaxID=1197127 RepID=A0ABU6G4B2_9BACL|nr:YkvA family protein [Paenibacillus alba]MEC0228460.1 YkvA family protein [Paenibacillus alba]